MFNYSMMSSIANPTMYGAGASYLGNEYMNMRNRYGYPYSANDCPSAPISSVQRTPHVVVERNRFLNFLKKIF